MSKEVIAIDVDEVLLPFIQNFLLDYNQENGTNYQPHDFSSYHFHGPLGISVEESVEKVYSYLRQDHSHIEPLEGVEEALEWLSARFDLEIVTARHPEFEVNTLKWLQDKLPDRFRALKMIGYSPVMEKSVTKAEICMEINAIALIDDSLDHVTECAAIGVRGLLFGDYPWNQAEKLPYGVTRCRDWQEVVAHFNV